MRETERYEPSGYIKTLLFLVSLVVSLTVFGLIRTLVFFVHGPNLFSLIFIACWLLLTFKMGYKLWKKR